MASSVRLSRAELENIVGKNAKFIRAFEEMQQTTTVVVPDQFEAVSVFASIAQTLIDEQAQRLASLESQVEVLQALVQQGSDMPFDDFQGVEYLPEQISAGVVLTFTFSQPVQQVWVELGSTTSTNTARVRTDGVDPTLTTGGIIHAGAVLPFLDTTSEVRVLATTGDTVTVYGYYR